MNEPRIAIYEHNLEVWTGSGPDQRLKAYPVHMEAPIPQDIVDEVRELQKIGKQVA